MTRKAADNCNLPSCPPPQSVQPPSLDSVTTTSQQDVTVINSQTTKSTSYSTDQNVATQISVYAKSYFPCDLLLPSPELDPFDSVSTRQSARDVRSVFMPSFEIQATKRSLAPMRTVKVRLNPLFLVSDRLRTAKKAMTVSDDEVGGNR